MANYINVGQILMSKKGNLNIKIKEDVNLKKDEVIFINDATDKFQRMLEKGKITEEQFNDEMEAHGEGGRKAFIKYDLTLVRE